MKLTDAEIRRAVGAGKAAVLSDGNGKGTGRLVLIIRVHKRVTAEWYIRVQRDGKRSSVKVGSYPEISLSGAREAYKLHQEGIAQGKPVRAAVSSPNGSLEDLFTGYLVTLEGRASYSDAKVCLGRMAEAMGKHRPANSITTADIVAFLRPIYQRGTVRMADKYRAFIRAAYGWGMGAEADYRTAMNARFRIVVNPAAPIPAEGVAVGTRVVTVDELRELFRWMDNRTTHRAIRAIVFSGLRPSEVVSIHSSMISDGLITWSTTKNGKPHTLPWWGGEFQGWLFPSEFNPETHVDVGTVYSALWRHGAGFSLRDLRRTWKTLAGEAGISKELRDIWQNHSRSDVSSVHYDRYQYLPEKREVLRLWSEWFAQKIENPA